MFFTLLAKTLFSEETKFFKYFITTSDNVFEITLEYFNSPLNEFSKITLTEKLTETTETIFHLQKDLTTVVFNTKNFIPVFEISPEIKTIFKATSLPIINSASKSLVIENTIPYILTADNLQELKIDGLLPINILEFKDKITTLHITTDSESTIDLSNFTALNHLSINKKDSPVKITLLKNYLFETFSCTNCSISTVSKEYHQF